MHDLAFAATPAALFATVARPLAFLVQVLDTLFLVGMIGSALVVVLTLLEDMKTLVEKDPT